MMYCTDCSKEITHGYFRMIDELDPLEIYLQCYKCHEANNG
jgi:hypothetical protein